MRLLRVAICLLGLCAIVGSASAQDDRALVSRVLALVQPIVHLGAHSPDPQAAHRAIEEIVAGRNEEANRIAADVFDGALSDAPPEHRPALRAIGRDLLVILRRQREREFRSPPAAR